MVLVSSVNNEGEAAFFSLPPSYDNWVDYSIGDSGADIFIGTLDLV
eukprot:CAMPEP_0172402708 /NCGR_PEP_ID=MMETSP1061-20121228/55679_1 /TAXON_ID=37318 /ORGANISM="Pseudo-nitzschia pungens, Strain cf. pungens" /LENGTH=45 /DNA_ID= /DNA_START= /DNA_END= /DNA_ORIENTATION=